MQEDHGDGRDAAVDEAARNRGQLVAIEPLSHGAVRLDPFRDLEATMAGHQRLRPGDVEVVELELPLAADLERVRESRGGDEPGGGALAFDEGVGEQGGGVNHTCDAGGVDPILAEHPGQAGRHRAGRVLVRGEDLAVDLASAVVIVDDDVGEGAADVDAEGPGHGRAV
jgi:hypothetical protein